MQRFKLLLCSIFILFSYTLSAQSRESVPVYQGFSGGMMLHTGYLFGKSEAPSLNQWSGATFGIGGALRVNLWNHLRVGGEGFVSTMPSSASNLRQQLANGSYVRNGWGGILVDACWRNHNKVWPYIGGSIGGGACKSLYIYEGNQSDWLPEDNALYNKQAYMYVNPYVGLDYCMTAKVHLTFRLDWMIAIAHTHLVMPTGPRIYFGFMFCH